MFNYEIAFKNGMRVTFKLEERLDLHTIDRTKPLIFKDLYVNMDEVITIGMTLED